MRMKNLTMNSYYYTYLNDNHKDEFINFQERFYLLADKIDELLKTAVSDNSCLERRRERHLFPH